MIETPNIHKDMRNPEIVTVGTVNVDLIMGPQAPWPVPGTEVILPTSEMREGGGAGITAKALTSLGAQHRMIVNVGNDLFGEWLLKQYPGLDDDWIIDTVDTALTVGITHPDGERTFFSTPGHVAQFQPLELQNKLAGMDLKNVVVLFVGTSLMPTIRPALKEIFQFVRSKGGRIALDTAWPTAGWTDNTRKEVLGWLPFVDIALLNEVETHGLLHPRNHEDGANYQDALKSMPDDALFITKMGPRGARLDTLGKPPLIIPSNEIDVVDTIGAGDSFNAGFLTAFARGHDIQSCLEIAINTAAFAISSNPRRYPSGTEVGLAELSRKLKTDKVFNTRKQAV
ncbi:carbohydrate kinase family protein [Kiloniella antarctica]|uniref:Carbohydrate kinase family protein n=1 Tax=Kiloniella antarctica TaxID=1550907 RepID=A0ABW5BSS8_9PROT